MATFAYNVRNATGAVQNGTLTAESRVDALNTLRSRGDFVISLNEQDTESTTQSVFGGGFFQRVKLEELAVFFKQLSAMVGAGISITRCMTTLAKQQKNSYFAGLLLNIKTDVASGMPMSSAMAKYPRVFNPMVVSLVLSAEETGTLDNTLEQLAASFEAEVNLRQQISAGVRYPMIISIAAALVVSFVMIFVVPQFKEIFSTLDAKLPLMTAIVVAVAMFMKRFWYLALGLPVALPWLMNLLNSMPATRYTIDALKLRMPVFGELNKKIILARLSRVFATMLKAGVPILKALTIVKDTALNAIYEKSLINIRNAVKEGRNLTNPMESYPALYPPMVTAMIAVGEESGTLDHMLTKVNDFYTMEIESTVKKLTALIEPVLIGVLGAIIGFIVIALWMPLFKVIQLISELD